MAKKLLAVTDATTDEEMKALKTDLEQAKVEKKEIAVLILDTADMEVKETMELAKAADAAGSEEAEEPKETPLRPLDSAGQAEGTNETEGAVPSGDVQPDSEQAPSGVAGDAQSGQLTDAGQPAPAPTYEVQPSESFSGAQLSSQPTPALGMETPVAPSFAPPSTGAAVEMPVATPSFNQGFGDQAAAPAPLPQDGFAGQAAAPAGVFQPAEVPAAPTFTPPANNNNAVDNIGSSNGAGAAMQPPVSAYNYNLSQPVEREIE
mgnify:CR=1 FL=1